MCTPYCVYIHPSLDGFLGHFWLLWKMSLWSWGFKYFFKSLPPVLSDMHPKRELLDHMEILLLIFGGNTRLFYSGCIILYSFQQCTGVPTSLHLSQHYFPFLCFLTLAPQQAWSVSSPTQTLFPWSPMLCLLLPNMWSMDQQRGHHLCVFGMSNLASVLALQNQTLHFNVIPAESENCWSTCNGSSVGAQRLKYKPHLGSSLSKIRPCWKSKLGFSVVYRCLVHSFSLKETNLKGINRT